MNGLFYLNSTANKRLYQKDGAIYQTKRFRLNQRKRRRDRDEKGIEKAGRRIAFEPVLPFVFVLAGTLPATINVGKVYLTLMVLQTQVDSEKG